MLPPVLHGGRRFLCCVCFCDTPCAEDVYRNGLILGGGGPATGDARELRLLLLFRLYALWGNSILPYGLKKFARFAVIVWGVDPAGRTDEETAREGLAAMERWMKELGLVMNISELGVKESMLEELADVTLVMNGGYKTLGREEIVEIFRESL